MNACSNALMRPTEVFFNRFINPQPLIGNQNLVQEIALRVIALVGMMITAPVYFMGLWCKILSRFLTIAREEPAIPLQHIPRPLIQLPLIRETPEIEEAAMNLLQLEQFSANPTWERYHNIPLAQKYLIAGRHTYPHYWGWNFVTKFTLLNAFEGEFRTQPNLAGAQAGIREAIRIQEKILFVYKMKQALIQGLDLNLLREQDRNTFTQVLYYVAREYECRREDNAPRIGLNMLLAHPHDRRTHAAFESMLFSLKAAYEPERLPRMHPDRDR